MRNRKTLSVFLLGLFGVGLYRSRRRLIGAALGLRPVRHEVLVERNLRVPTSGGITLATDHYYPKSNRLFPTILIRTPYGRSREAGLSGVLPAFEAQRFAERGYNVVVQDVRGRFDSDGEFEPFAHEAVDGRATLEWIERQPWFNGVLGMWGQSYVGYTLWAAASGAPLYLKAIVPVITGSQMPKTVYPGGFMGIDTLLRWLLTLDSIDSKGRGRLAGLLRLSQMNPLVVNRMLGRALRHLPLQELDQKVLGRRVPYFQNWVAHMQPGDPYWNTLDTRWQTGQVTAAAHLISGWYDIFLPDLLSDYADLRRLGGAPYLTIGPWRHIDTECLWESLRQGVIWFDAFLKGDRRSLRESPVCVYVMGGGGWRMMESWPPASRQMEFYLQAGGGLSPEPPPAGSAPDTYVYDPAHPTPALGGPLMSLHGGPRDNRPLERRQDVLVYTTPPLDRDTEVIGPVRLTLYVHSSREHTDFFGRLCEVDAGGRSTNLCDGLVRLRPGLGAPQPDGSLRVELDFWPTANRFAAGHTIRLLVASGAFPRIDRNLGGGEPTAAAQQMHSAVQTIYHDRDHPSALALPVTSS